MNHYTRFTTPLVQTWAYIRQAKLNFFLSGVKIGIGLGVRDLKARATGVTDERITAYHSALVQSWELGYHLDLPIRQHRIFLTAELDSYHPQKTRHMTASAKSMNLTPGEEENIKQQLMEPSLLVTVGAGIYLW